MFVGYLLSPISVHAISFSDDLIFHAPFNNPDNPLEVRVGSGQFTYKRVTSATYIHPITNLVTIAGSNALPMSEDFSTTWVPASVQVITDQSLAPDGNMTADQIIVGPASDGNVVHTLQMAAAPTGNILQSQVYTSSIYVKQNSNIWIALAVIGKSGAVNSCYFNTATGAIGTCAAGVLSRTSTDVGSGWYRFSVSANIMTGGATVSTRIYLAEADNDFTWIGNATNSVYFWGAQMNSGPALAPYVHTTTENAALARIESDGYLSEGTRTNFILWSRDFTNAVWTKTNINVSQTATGHDGVANSASTITATANDGTVCQGVTIATATSSGSVDIKRVSGSGTVSISMDGGVTYSSDVSSQLSTSSWYRAILENQSIANPSLCIKLGTSGDSVILDYAQIETSGPSTAPTHATFVSSRIPTASGTHTRYLDKLSIPSAGNWPTTEGTFFAIGDTWDTNGGNKFIVDGYSGASRVPLHIRSALGNGSGGILGRTTSYDGAAECSYSSVNVDPRTPTKMISRWSATSGTRATTASGAIPTSCAFDGVMEVQTLMVFGDAYNQDATRSTFGHIKNARFYSTAFSDVNMQLATSSLTTDIGSVPTAPTIGAATAGNTQATVTFTAPSSDGGNSITSYTVTSSPGNITATGSSSPITVTGLTNGVEYTFTVTATNAIGTSPASSVSNAVIPSAPTATAFTFTGPTSGNINTTSTDFTVTPNNTYTGTITITPTGTASTGLTPTTLTFSNSSTPQTFTITPTVAGSITLTPTNNGGLSNPSNIVYTSNAVVPTAPVVTTPTSSSLTKTSVILGVIVESLGNPASISARGICISTSSNPTLLTAGSTCIAEGETTTGVFSQSFIGLTPGTLYYYRGYATNDTGTGYSNNGTFTTSSTSSGGGGGSSWIPKKITTTKDITGPQDQKTRQKVFSDFITKTLTENKRTGFATRLETVLLTLKVKGIDILKDYTCQKHHTDTSGTDVPDYTCQVAEKAQKAQFISQTNTEFKPLQPVSRIEAYSVMMKSICIHPQTTPTNWQTEVIKKAMELGFTVRTFDTFEPDRPLTVPEMYAVVKRLSDYGEENGACTR